MLHKSKEENVAEAEWTWSKLRENKIGVVRGDSIIQKLINNYKTNLRTLVFKLSNVSG